MFSRALTVSKSSTVKGGSSGAFGIQVRGDASRFRCCGSPGAEKALNLSPIRHYAEWFAVLGRRPGDSSVECGASARKL